MSDRRPAILHLRASNFVGGPERQILRYCRAASPDWRQIVATFTGSDAMGSLPDGVGSDAEGIAWLRQARAAGQEAWALPGGGWRDLQAVAALDRLLRQQQVALLCTHGYRADLLGTVAARRRRIPVAWFLRGWTGENWKVRMYESWDRALLNSANHLVCLSQSQATTLPLRISPDRISVVVNAVEAVAVDRGTARRELRQRFALAEEDGQGPPLVAIAGRLSPEKGAAIFLEAAAWVHRRCPRIHFLVFGDGPLRSTLEIAGQRLGLCDHLHLAGHIPDWTRLLPGLDLLVNPSLAEQAPNVVLEGMAASVPVLATAVGAVAEIAGLGGATPPSLELVPPREAGALASAMLALMNDPQRRTELATRGLHRLREAYSPERQQSQLGELYRRLCLPNEQKRRSPPLAASLSSSPAVRGVPKAPELPMVSIVLPVRNEAAHLGRLLEQLLGQDYPAERYEILISDGSGPGGGDGTTELAQDYARRFAGRIQWLPNLGRTSAAGRNRGLEASRGDWILFVDGHCILPGAAWLGASMGAAFESGALCLSRPQPLIAEGGRIWQKSIAETRATRIGHGADSTIYGDRARGWVPPDSSAASYHRSLFTLAGQYDENFDACEDVEFNHRLNHAGIRAWFCPEAVVYYAARSNLHGLWRQMVRYGRGRVRLARKHPDAWTLPQCLPALWLAWLPPALAGAAFCRGDWQAASVAGLLLYAGVIAVYAIRLGWRHGWRHSLAAPVVYFTIHAALGTGTWRELASPPRRHTAAGATSANASARKSSPARGFSDSASRSNP